MTITFKVNQQQIEKDEILLQRREKIMGDGFFGNFDNSEILFFILIFLCLFFNQGFDCRDKC